MKCVKCKEAEREYNKYCYYCAVGIIADFKENQNTLSIKNHKRQRASELKQTLRSTRGIKKALKTWNYDMEKIPK